MLLHEWALGIEPFEHDVFAFVLRNALGLALRIGQRKIGRGGADGGRVGGEERGGSSESEKR